MAANPFLAFLALFLTAGGLLLDLFIILSGTFINVKPINLTYFLSAGGSTWTYWSVCALSGSQNANCGSIRPALPFQPASQGQMMVPTGITSSSKFYYYMPRVAWAFFLIAAFFAAITLFSGIFACCSRIFGRLSGLNAFAAMGSQAVAAALMTAWTVKARNAYQAAGQTAGLGRYGYGFAWAALVCFFLAMILFCSSGAGRKKKDTEENNEQMMEEHHQQHHVQQDEPVYRNTGPTYQNTTTTYEPPPTAPPVQTTYDPQPVTYTSAPAPYQTPATTYQSGPTYPATATPIHAQPATTGFFNRDIATKAGETGAKDEYS